MNNRLHDKGSGNGAASLSFFNQQHHKKTLKSIKTIKSTMAKDVAAHEARFVKNKKALEVQQINKKLTNLGNLDKRNS
jgi:hypothetical protein